jgi:hypothetical protein
MKAFTARLDRGSADRASSEVSILFCLIGKENVIMSMIYNLGKFLGWWSAFSSPVTWVLIVGAAAIIAAIVFTVVKAKKNKGGAAK